MGQQGQYYNQGFDPNNMGQQGQYYNQGFAPNNMGQPIQDYDQTKSEKQKPVSPIQFNINKEVHNHSGCSCCGCSGRGCLTWFIIFAIIGFIQDFFSPEDANACVPTTQIYYQSIYDVDELKLLTKTD